MPTIKGNLLFVSSRAAQVSEVWVRAREVRTHAEGVVTTGNDRFPVTGGEVSFTAVPGPAVLALISQGRAVDTIPILVGDGAQQTLRQVVEAAEVADDATKREIEKLAAQVIELLDSSTANVKAAQDGASRAETAASNAKTSETRAASSASGAVSAQSEARKSASAAASSASSANTDAGQARSSASSAAESAEVAKTSEEMAGQRAVAADEAAKAVERVGTAQALGVEDLNDVTAQGVYSQDRNANASTGRNYPVGRAGLLEVFNPPWGAQVYQRYTTYGDYQDVYVRGSQTGSWGSWKKLSQDGHSHGMSDVVGLEARFATSPYNSITVKTEGEAQALSGLRKGDYVHVLDTGNVYIWE